MAFAGIDVGTSGCKMVVYDADGTMLAKAKRTYKEFGGDGYRRICPNNVWQSVQETIKEVVSNCVASIEGIAIASLGESVVCMGQNDEVLYDSMVTGDKTGIKECKEVESKVSKKQIMKITGLPISEMYSLPKLIWMNQNTDVFQRAEKIFFYEDFIAYMLTGNRKVSYSSASRSMAFDIRKKQWSSMLLEMAGISVTQMSDAIETGEIIGTITREMAMQTGLSEKTVVVVGGWDQAMAGVGSGMIHSDVVEDGQGTCEVMLSMLPNTTSDEYMLLHELSRIPYVISDTYITMVEVTTCGILMNWIRDMLFAQEKDFFSSMDQQATENPTGLLVLPQFGSSGHPHVNYNAKGAIWGLTIHTTQAEIYQAIKEGLAYQMLLAYELLEPLDVETKTIHMTGGGAVSEYTAQLRANIFNKKIVIQEGWESGTLGCAIVAAVSTGYYKDYKEAVSNMVHIQKVFTPKAKIVNQYRESYKKYKDLYEKIYQFNM